MISNIFKVVLIIIVIGAAIFMIEFAWGLRHSPSIKQDLTSLNLDLAPKIPVLTFHYYSPAKTSGGSLGEQAPPSTSTAENYKLPAPTYSRPSYVNSPASVPSAPAPTYYSGNQNYTRGTGGGPAQVSN